MKQLFELEWNDDLGEDWMNVWNLELLIYSEQHTKKELVKVKEIESETTED